MFRARIFYDAPVLNGYTVDKDGREWAKYRPPDNGDKHMEIHAINEVLTWCF